jgi:U3 small nucleolar RNA-associated protein MPP10
MGVSAADEHAPVREQARVLFEKVCSKLNALSNFTYAPRAKVLEMKVTPSVAAIQMEEIIPLAVSTAQAQAPEEVKIKNK